MIIAFAHTQRLSTWTTNESNAIPTFFWNLQIERRRRRWRQQQKTLFFANAKRGCRRCRCRCAIAIIITLIMINNNNNLFTISPFANVFLLALLVPTKFVNKLSIRNGVTEGESMQHLANIDSHCVCWLCTKLIWNSWPPKMKTNERAIAKHRESTTKITFDFWPKKKKKNWNVCYSWLADAAAAKECFQHKRQPVFTWKRRTERERKAHQSLIFIIFY